MIDIKHNLELAIDYMEQQNATKFNLTQYVRVTDCGTLYCTAGLLATKPEFIQQGFCSDKSGEVEFDGNMLGIGPGADALFGESSFDRLFDTYRSGVWDDELIGNQQNISDKELALMRLRKQLELYGEE
jgi:hypothetical protein